MDKIIHNRKFRLLIAFISLLLLIDLVQDTYAKYITSVEANAPFTIARWYFEVNEQDVISNSDFSNTIVPQFDSNANIASGVIAPTSTGHFEVEIDATDVGVSYDQVISLVQSDDNTVSDIRFTGYKIGEGSVIDFDDQEHTSITTTHLLGQGSSTTTYTFYIEWLDGTGETMDNEDDTEAAANGTAAVTVNIQFIQKASQNNNNNNNG